MPKTTRESQILWLSGFAISLLLAFLAAWLKQANTIPVDEPIVWRLVFIDVIGWVLTASPIAGLGLTLPKYGREEVSARVSELGKKEALSRLDDNSATITTYSNLTDTIDYGKLATVLLRMKAFDDAKQKDVSRVTTSN